MLWHWYRCLKKCYLCSSGQYKLLLSTTSFGGFLELFKIVCRRFYFDNCFPSGTFCLAAYCRYFSALGLQHDTDRTIRSSQRHFSCFFRGTMGNIDLEVCFRTSAEVANYTFCCFWRCRSNFGSFRNCDAIEGCGIQN